jgi:hypothetical protein
MEALTNGSGRDIVERTAFQYAELSSLVQPRQRIDKFPQERASGLPGASSVSPDRPCRSGSNSGAQPTRQPKQTSPRYHRPCPLIQPLSTTTPADRATAFLTVTSMLRRMGR